jgi:hypothetical protein
MVHVLGSIVHVCGSIVHVHGLMELISCVLHNVIQVVPHSMLKQRVMFIEIETEFLQKLD